MEHRYSVTSQNATEENFFSRRFPSAAETICKIAMCLTTLFFNVFVAKYTYFSCANNFSRCEAYILIIMFSSRFRTSFKTAVGSTFKQQKRNIFNAEKPFSKENIPFYGAAVGITALSFQVMVLYPWHEELSTQFSAIQVTGSLRCTCT